MPPALQTAEIGRMPPDRDGHGGNPAARLFTADQRLHRDQAADAANHLSDGDARSRTA